MSIGTLKEELVAYKEILEVAIEDLHVLLTCEYSPHVRHERIYEEYKASLLVSNIKYLIWETESTIISKKLYNDMMLDYALSCEMGRTKL